MYILYVSMSVALVIRHATRMRHVFICGLSRSTVFFPHYLINDTIFEKMLLNTKCVFWFSLQLLSETFLIPRRTERDVIKNVYWSSCKVPDILSDCNETWTVSTDFSKSTHLSNFMKIRQVGAELFHADGQTWRILRFGRPCIVV